jgi:DNA-binding NarL/FixJ family response regulator
MAASAGKQRPKAVLIVDDHEIMRQGLRRLIEQEPGMAVCAEAADLRSARKALIAHRPDAAIVDIVLSDGSGLDLIKDIVSRHPDCAVLVLSMHNEPVYAERALRSGARGYVLKSEAAAHVIEGLRQVLAGHAYVSGTLASRMLTSLVAGRGDADPVSRLTDREFEVFELVGRGVGTQDIASRLHISAKTVAAHRENIKRKLGFGSATELMAYAVRWTSLESGPPA